jgi:hypothetical protein
MSNKDAKMNNFQKYFILFIILVISLISYFSFSKKIEIAGDIVINNANISNPDNLSKYYKETRSLAPCFVCQAAIGQSNFLPIDFLEKGFSLQKSVVKIKNCIGQDATGFMISPSFLLTNNHEISDPSCAQKSFFEFNNQIYANGTVGIPEDYTADLSIFHNNESLDYTVIKLNGNPGSKWGYIDLPRPSSTFPQLFNKLISNLIKTKIIDDNSFSFDTLQKDNLNLLNEEKYIHANILQHPDGKFKQVGLQDNYLTSVDENHGLIRYTTDTDDGSSGSPVFNDNWDLIALHHAKGEMVFSSTSSINDQKNGFHNEKWLYVDNEGILINHIVDDLVNFYKKTPNGDLILKEIGILKTENK